MRYLLIALALLACQPDDPPELPAACRDTCGTTWTGDEWLYCEPCMDDETIDRRMRPVEEIFDLLWSRSYMQEILPLDRSDILDHAAEAFRADPIASRARMSAQWRVVQAFGNGHSGIVRTDVRCAERGGGDPGQTLYGSCVVPYGEDFVVTQRSSSLGLRPGERVVAVNQIRGQALIDWLADGPLCGSAAGHPSAVHALAADAMMSVIRPGDQLTVLDLQGEERDVIIPQPGSPQLCREFSPRWIEGRVRDDGVAVITVHRWILYEGERGHAGTDFDTTMRNMIDQAEAVFNDVAPGAPGLLFDIRGNSGGYSRVGFAIVEGMPGARSHHLATCRGRVPDTDPIAYTGELVYQLEPGDRFLYEGPVAVLADEHSVSASDYFALAMQQSTDARLFGRATRGAFGGGAPTTSLDRTEDTVIYIDTARCDDAEGEPLETLGVMPDEWIDLAPEDAAAGIDTVEEAAATWVLSQP